MVERLRSYFNKHHLRSVGGNDQLHDVDDLRRICKCYFIFVLHMKHIMYMINAKLAPVQFLTGHQFLPSFETGILMSLIGNSLKFCIDKTSKLVHWLEKTPSDNLWTPMSKF